MHVLGFALSIFLVLELFASETLLSALEVVVLALVALPASFREIEVAHRLALSLLLGLLGS